MYPYTKKFSKNIFFIAFIFLKNNSLYLNKIDTLYTKIFKFNFLKNYGLDEKIILFFRFLYR